MLFAETKGAKKKQAPMGNTVKDAFILQATYKKKQFPSRHKSKKEKLLKNRNCYRKKNMGWLKSISIETKVTVILHVTTTTTMSSPNYRKQIRCNSQSQRYQNHDNRDVGVKQQRN